VVTINLYGLNPLGNVVEPKIKQSTGFGVIITDNKGNDIAIADDDRERLTNLAAAWDAANPDNDDEFYGAFEQLRSEAVRTAKRFYGAN
jgi:hypothetical protein